MGNLLSGRKSKVETEPEKRERIWCERTKLINEREPILDAKELEERIKKAQIIFNEQIEKNEVAREKKTQYIAEHEEERVAHGKVSGRLVAVETSVLGLLTAIILLGGWMVKVHVDSGIFLSTGTFSSSPDPSAQSIHDIATCQIGENGNQTCEISDFWKQKYLFITPSKLYSAGLSEDEAHQVWDSLYKEKANSKQSYMDVILVIYQFLIPNLTMTLAIAWLGLLVGSTTIVFFMIGMKQDAVAVMSTMLSVIYYFAGKGYWGSDDYLVRIPGGCYVFCSVVLVLFPVFHLIDLNFVKQRGIRNWTNPAAFPARIAMCLIAIIITLVVLFQVPFGPLVFIITGMAMYLYIEACMMLIALVLQATGRDVVPEWGIPLLITVFGAMFTFLAVRLDVAGSLDAVYGSSDVDDGRELPEILKIPMAIHFSGAGFIWCGLSALFLKPFVEAINGTSVLGIIIYLFLQIYLVLLGLKVHRSVLLFFGVLGILIFEFTVFKPTKHPQKTLVERYYHLPHLLCSFGLLGLSGLIRQEAYVMFGVLESVGGVIMGPLGILCFSTVLIFQKNDKIKTPRVLGILVHFILCYLSVIQQREGTLCVGLLGIVMYFSKLKYDDIKSLLGLGSIGFSLALIGIICDGLVKST